MEIIYNINGSYTIKQKGWSLTGPSWLIVEIMEDCFNMTNSIRILKRRLKSTK